MADSSGYDASQAVAIIGMVGRFPGARNLAEFWRNLATGRETISRFSRDELEPSSPEEAASMSDPLYVPARGILEGAELFDPSFFGVLPKEAEVMDPQQRVFLESAWEALEDAGYDPQAYRGAIGVFAGMSNNTYFQAHVRGHPEVIELVGSDQTMMANEKDYLATRVSYKLDLRGPSVNVVTACSTSLVAVHQAVQSLLNYQCDMALAGGVSVKCPQKRGYLYQEGFILSPDGHCRAFDARAQGTVFSNGVGVVVLKRLPDALADRDHIYAVIRGAAINNDGSGKVSFAAPSVDGQAEVIAMAHALAGVEASRVSYVETHGTGTALGDPIEIAGLTQAFRAGPSGKGYCAIGSLKTNIGHLDAAAGVAGLIKTSLALHHEAIPPSLHFEVPNPEIDLSDSPFFVNTSLREWKRGATERLAGVSSFGAGGTNAHVVLEEAPAPPVAAPGRKEQLLVLSARSREALDVAAANLARRLEEQPTLDLADVAFTLQVGRRAFPHRRALVARDAAGAISALRAKESKQVLSGHCDTKEATVAFLFPGQGAQYAGMGRRLYSSEPRFRREVSECAEILRPVLGCDLRDVLYPESGGVVEAQRLLGQTSLTQPALFVVEYAAARLWMEWGVRPSAMIGHSLGEYVAACLAGVWSRDDALRLVAERAALMQAVAEGAMLAVRSSAASVEARLRPGLAVAAVNAPNMTVISGPRDSVAQLEAGLDEKGVAYRRLATSHAFHSPMMDVVLEPFREVLRRRRPRPPQIPWVSSLTGDWITSAEAESPEYWVRQLREPVRFLDGMTTLLRDERSALLEVGPGQTLASLVRHHPNASNRPVAVSFGATSDPDREIEAMLGAAGRLWTSGAKPDWTALHGEARPRVSLPTYPFERKRYWLEPVSAPVRATAEGRSGPLPATPALASPEVEAEGAKSNEGGMSDLSVTAETGSARRDQLLLRLRALFGDLSGIEPGQLDPSASFLEAGFDSLFLTQVGTAIQKTFGTRVTFRELIEEFATLESLAGRLAELLPEPPASVSGPAPGPASLTREENMPRANESVPASPGLTPTRVPTSLVERVLAQQMELMSRQLELLQAGGLEGAAAAVALSSNGNAARTATSAAASPPTAAPAADRAVAAFGPYKPIAKGSSGGLTSRQQSHLNALIERYTKRTAGSKRLTQANRTRLADPRTVAGFRSIWKEMVYPIVVDRSAGSKLWDVDGNEYIDLTNGFGMTLFGHSPAFVTEALREQLARGIEIGPQTPLAGQVAELFCAMTGMERVAFCNTGSEAVMAAIRVARTVTGRERIAMFSGAYHGVFDEVLARAGTSRGVAKSMPIAPGIPSNMTDSITVFEYGSAESLQAVEAQASDLAAVLVEPVQSRRPELQPREFLHDLRQVTAAAGTALIFDEVVSGFRVHPGGIQALYGINADLATYGKVVGGGLPIGLVAGRHEYMDALDGGKWAYGDDSFPEVGVTFFAGTFVRHPLALAAAHAVLQHLRREGPELQERLNRRTTELVDAMARVGSELGAPVRITHFSSWFCFAFPSDVTCAGLFYAYMRDRGIHIWEGRAGFITTAHSDADLERVVAAFRDSIAEMQEAGFLPRIAAEPPAPGARKGRDAAGNDAWFVPDPDRPGKYLQVLVEQGSRE
jgi:acyl transferase domain-containing protein/glutamate-1-semialdehyde aminotransferase